MKSQTTRFVSLVLAIVLSFSLCAPALAAGQFPDVPKTHWAYNDIMECANLGVVSGFADGTFRPDDDVTDIEFIVMLTQTFCSDKVEDARRSKPADSPWYWPNISVADDLKITFALTMTGQAMSRQDAALALSNVLFVEGTLHNITTEQYVTASETLGDDYYNIAEKRRPYVLTCYAAGVLGGMSDGKFHGEESITRAQACTVILRMLKVTRNYTPSSSGSDAAQNPGTGTLANGKPITTENVLEILDQIKAKYPNNSTWNSNTAYSAIAGEDMVNLNKQFKGSTTHTYGSVSLRQACGGFAAMVSETIFGRSGFPFRQVTNGKDVRPGDVMITLNAAGEITHYSIVSSNPVQYSNGYYQFACVGGNVGGKVVWESTTSNAIIANRLLVFTRYPEE